MRSFTAVVNPAAGGGAAAKLIPVARLLREAGAQVTVEYSRSLEHAGELGRAAADGGDTVIAVGGDGMVGGLAGALAGTPGELAILPAGRGNDFARQLGLPHDAAGLAGLFLSSHAKAVDVIEVVGGSRVVVGSVYGGVDSLANVHINRSRLPAALAYHYGALRAMLEWKPARYEITVDGETHEEVCYTVGVANSQYYGHGRRAAPDASIEDGLLDVIIFRHCAKPTFVAIAMKEIYAGTHLRRPVFTVLRGREVHVEADRPITYAGDGELLGTLPADMRVLPSALRVLA